LIDAISPRLIPATVAHRGSPCGYTNLRDHSRLIIRNLFTEESRLNILKRIVGSLAGKERSEK